MTVSTTTNRVSYNGNSVTTAFSFPYLFLADADLVVILVSAAGVETTQTITTHYTVTGATNPAGGTVTMLIAPATGQKLVIYRDPALTQTTDVVEGDPLPVETVLERPLDKLTMISQRNRELANRSMRLSDGDTSGASVVLPTPAASKLLGWNGGATALVNYAAADLTGTVVSAFAETLLDDASASDARTTLGLGTLAVLNQVPSGSIGPTELAATAVTPAAYTNANITVDADGRVTAAANGSSGKLVQRVYDEERAYSNNTGYTAIPSDDTKPAITEGVEILSVTITPTSVSNRIRARGIVPYGPNSGVSMACSIHRDSGDALATTVQYSSGAQWQMTCITEVEEVSPGTSAVTYSVRIGGISANVGFEIGAQGGIGARNLGGARVASLVVEEIVP